MKKLVDPPDDLRFHRNDGRRWRCKNMSANNGAFCEEHQIQNIIRRNKFRASWVSKKKSNVNSKEEKEEEVQSETRMKKKKKRKGKISGSSSSLAARFSTELKQRVSDDPADTGTIQQTMHDDASYHLREGRADSQIVRRKVQPRKRGLGAIMKRCYEESKLGETMMKEVELEKDLEVCKNKCHELSVELENKKMECIAIQDKFRDLEFRNIAVEDELKEYKTMCDGLKECIMCLEEDQKVKCEKEKKAQERIMYLEEELKKMERDERPKFVQLKTDNRDLECMKRRAEDEIEVFKKRLCKLETRVLRMEDQNSTLRCIGSHASGNIELEPGGLQNEVSHNDEGEKDINNSSKLQGETNGRTNSAHVGHLQATEKELNANEKILTSAIAGPPSINMHCEPALDVEEKEKNAPSESKVEFRNKVRKQLVLELEGSSKKRPSVFELGSVRPASDGHTIEISDSDSTSQRSCDNEKYVISKKCLKRLCLDQRGEKYGSSCGEDFPFTSIHKRKRASEIITSESECEDEVKMKKCQELKDEVPKPSPLDLCSETLNVSCGGQNVEAKKGWAERTSQNECTSPNHLEMGRASYEKVCSPTAENGKEKKNVVEEVGLDSEGESLGGFILEGSDSSDSGDSSSDSEGKVMAMIFRRRDKELKWKFGADMLSSFEENPELCMKAVCALYRQRTSEEESMKGFFHSNTQGFNKFDALRGTTLAEFLMEGDWEGDLKKSVKELETFDPKGLEECKRLARHYSEQLFTIYQNKEDPFFLSSSASSSR